MTECIIVPIDGNNSRFIIPFMDHYNYFAVKLEHVTHLIHAAYFSHSVYCNCDINRALLINLDPLNALPPALYKLVRLWQVGGYADMSAQDFLMSVWNTK